MSKNLILVLGLFIFLAIGLVLFFLPKSVVDNDKKLVGSQPELKADSSVSELDGSHQMNSSSLGVISNWKSAAAKETNLKKKSDLFSSVGKEFLKGNQFDSAGHYLELAAENSPGNKGLIFEAGNAYFEGLTFATSPSKLEFLSQKARKCFEKLEEADSKSSEAKAKIAMTYVNSEAPMKGILMLRELAEKYPENEYIAYQLGILSFQSNQFEKAIGRFEKVLKINPENVNANYYLAQSFLQIGRNKESLPFIEKGLKLAKEEDTKASFLELKQQAKGN